MNKNTKKLKDLNENEKNVLTSIVFVLIFISFLIYLGVSKLIEAKKEQEESQKTVLVTDAGRYFTAVNCVKSYLNYVQRGNTDDMLLLLNEEYKEANRITASTVRNHIPKLEYNYMYDYVGEEMYQHRISKNVVEYYIKGRIKKSQMDEDSTYSDYDVTVVLYEDKFLYSIKPRIGGLYDEQKQ